MKTTATIIPLTPPEADWLPGMFDRVAQLQADLAEILATLNRLRLEDGDQ